MISLVRKKVVITPSQLNNCSTSSEKQSIIFNKRKKALNKKIVIRN